MSGGVWMASYVALWVAVAVLLVMVLALVRQIGVLHARLDDGVGAGLDGAVDGESVGGQSVGVRAGGGGGGGAVGEPLSAAEGPPLGSPAPMGGRIGYQRAPLTLVAFTSASCELSQVLMPALRVVDKQYDDVRVVELALGPRTIAAYEAFNVLHTPFVVAVGQDGRVRGRGRARNLQQLEAFVERALAVAAKAATRAAEGQAVVTLDLSRPDPAGGAEPAEPEAAAEPVAEAEPVETPAPADDAARAGV